MESTAIPPPGWMERARDWLETSMENAFYNHGLRVAERPKLYIILPVVLGFLCFIGFSVFEVETQPEKLYTPQDSEPFDNQRVVESIFGYGFLTSNVYAVAKAANGSVLTRDALLSLMDGYDAVRNTAGGNNTFDSLCDRPSPAGPCDQLSLLDLYGYNRTRIAEQTDDSILARVNAGNFTDMLGRPFVLELVAGGVVRNASGWITGAKALSYSLNLQNNKQETSDGGLEDEVAQAWQRAAAQNVRSLSSNTLLFFTISDGERSDAASSAISGDIQLLVLGYVLLGAYTCFVLSRRNWIYSYGSLGMVSICLIGVAIGADFALIQALGVTFSLPVQTLAFLLLGLGVDDTFVIMSAFMRQPLTLDVKTRVARAMRESGAPITLTSFTDIIAFLAGTYTLIPAIQAYCLYAAVGVLFDYILQVTAFVGALVLMAHREEDKRADVLCCWKPAEPAALCCAMPKRDFTVEKEPPLARFLRDKYGPIILSPAGRILGGAIVLGLLAMNIYGATTLVSNFNIEWFTPSDSYLQDSYKVRDQYFYRDIPFSQYSGDVDYPALQPQLDLLENSTLALPQVKRCISWWSAFKTWMLASFPAEVDGSGHVTTPASNFYPRLAQFVNSSAGFPFKSRISFKPGNTGIDAAQLLCFFDRLDNGDLEVKAMDAVVGVCKTSALASLECFAYSFPFLFWEGLRVIKEQTLINVLTAGIAVFVVCVLLLANLPAAILVVGVLAMIDADVLGTMWVTGYDFNTVSAINLVIAVGLAVDGPAHLVKSFLVQVGDRPERVRHALGDIGPSVIHGGLTTILAIIGLAGSQSYIFQVFFALLFAIMLYSLLHSLVGLPIILSFIGPDAAPSRRLNPNSSSSASEPSKPLVATTVI